MQRSSGHGRHEPHVRTALSALFPHARAAADGTIIYKYFKYIVKPLKTI